MDNNRSGQELLDGLISIEAKPKPVLWFSRGPLLLAERL